MSRACLLPFCGDPFLLQYWLKFYQNVWGEEVDKLYVCINSNVPDTVKTYCENLIKSLNKTRTITTLKMIDHGPALDALLGICEEEYVMLVEEDAIIFKKGIVDECFRRIESGEVDVVGSARGSCSKGIVDAGKRVYGTDDHGPNFWPNFFFCKKDLLLNTDRHFHAKSWNKGEYIKEVDYTVEEDVAVGDTFVWASLQIRAMNPKIHLVEQYHGYPHDLEDYVSQRNLWDGKCPWFHIGSLSGWYSDLMEETVRAKVATDGEYERRLQMWLTFYEESDPNEIVDFRNKYKMGIDRMIKEYGLKLSRIRERQRIYKQLTNHEN